MFNFIKSAFGLNSPDKKTIDRESVRAAGGFYDLERSDSTTDRHFDYALTGSADYHANQQVRETIRKKVRYEYANSTLFKGICLTRANSLIGQGPRLSLIADLDRSGSLDQSREVCKTVSKKFNDWALSVDLAEKMRQMAKAKTIDGESFLVFLESSRNEYGLFPRVVDSERVTSGSNVFGISKEDSDWVDGVKYDQETGEALSYRILKQHPGGDHTNNNYAGMDVSDLYNEYDENLVFHWYRKDHGEQHRGVSELMPALPTAAILRRTQKAIAVAVETAASLSMGLTTDIDTDEEDIELPSVWSQVPITPNMGTVFPNGVKPFQMKAENPNSEYSSFRDTCISDIGRSLNLPFNKASGTSAGYNFSSAMIDNIEDSLGNEIDRNELRRGLLNKAFKLFIAYGLNLGKFSPEEERYLTAKAGLPNHSWFFVTNSSDIEPLKQTKARVDAVEAGISTLESVVEKAGGNLEDHLEALANQYGKTVEEVQQAYFDKHFGIMQAPSGPELEEEDEKEEDEKEDK